MRIWRDIISSPAWTQVVDRFRTGDTNRHNNAMTTSSAKPVGKVNQLRGAFDRSVSSRDAALDKLTNKIQYYHSIAKSEYRNIDKRIAALKEVSATAQDLIKVFGVDLNFAAKRHNMSGQKDTERNAYTNWVPSQLSFDRHLLTLVRRSLRKAGYLKMLKAYYAAGGEGYAYRSPQALLALYNAPKEIGPEFVGLEPEVRLEQLDPVHRSNYEDHNDGGCGKAFQLWAADAKQQVPFFMWLEDSMVCRENDKAIASAQSVPYHRLDQKHGGGANGQRIVMFPAPLKAFDLDHPNQAPATCSTSTYGCDPPKDPTGGGGNGVAAYVWSEQSELFIAEHRGHVFHHSSFVSGRRVRCAGMIKIDNGFVTAISNNSGHYKPRKQQLQNMVRWLKIGGAFANNAVVEAFLGSGQAFTGTPDAFLKT
jgi:hypothetical protein